MCSTCSLCLQVFLLGGSWSGGIGTEGKKAEIFDPHMPKAWKLLGDIDNSYILTKDKAGEYRADNHAWFFGWAGTPVRTRHTS